MKSLIRTHLMAVAVFAAMCATAAFAQGTAPVTRSPATAKKPSTGKDAMPAVNTNLDAKPDTKGDAKKDDKKSYRPDRLDLDTTLVTGNRELPKVLYIVPWKKAELGELPAQPFNTLLDEVLQPVDREVFRREVKYFETVSNGANQAANPATAPGAVQVPK